MEMKPMSFSKMAGWVIDGYKDPWYLRDISHKTGARLYLAVTRLAVHKVVGYLILLVVRVPQVLRFLLNRWRYKKTSTHLIELIEDAINGDFVGAYHSARRVLLDPLYTMGIRVNIFLSQYRRWRGESGYIATAVTFEKK